MVYGMSFVQLLGMIIVRLITRSVDKPCSSGGGGEEKSTRASEWAACALCSLWQVLWFGTGTCNEEVCGVRSQGGKNGGHGVRHFSLSS